MMHIKLMPAVIALCTAVSFFGPLAGATDPATVVISQVYGGGGNSGALLKNDYIELYNAGSADVSLEGWSVQYGSSAGSTWQVTLLGGSISSGSYYLVQEAAGAGVGSALPTPDATGVINMSSASGKVALVSDISALVGACPFSLALVDLIGYGAANCAETSPTALLNNTTAALRNGNGSLDTNDNSSDFAVANPTPRNSAAFATLMISQVYGGGGNSGALLKNDYIELYNPGSADVSLEGWSVQYGSAAGSTWQVTPLGRSIAPGSYYLVQEAAGAGMGSTLPTPDATGVINMSSASGKVALVSNAVALIGACPSSLALVDLVGYGGANCAETSPATFLTNTSAALRNGDGSVDTNDNSADFAAGGPNPRSSSGGAR